MNGSCPATNRLLPALSRSMRLVSCNWISPLSKQCLAEQQKYRNRNQVFHIRFSFIIKIKFNIIAMI
jgi:hypothetical protein